MNEWVEKRMQKEKIMDTLTEVANPKKSTASRKEREGEVHTVTTKTNKPKGYRHNDLNYLPPNLLD